MTSTESDIVDLANHAKTCSWLNGYGAVSELVRLTNARNMLEVGVAYGYHALHILESNPGIEYLGLDPYVSAYDPDDQFSEDVNRLFPNVGMEAETINHSMDRLHSAVVHTLRRKSDSANVVRSDFMNFSKKNRNSLFDLIYIDGNHTEDYVFADTLIASLHIHENGLICGDDIERQSVQAGLAKAAKIIKMEPKLYQHKNGKLIWILHN